MLFIHQLTMLQRILNNGQTFLYVPAEKEERKDEIPFLVVILPPLLAKKSGNDLLFFLGPQIRKWALPSQY